MCTLIINFALSFSVVIILWLLLSRNLTTPPVVQLTATVTNKVWRLCKCRCMAHHRMPVKSSKQILRGQVGGQVAGIKSGILATLRCSKII
jgi:hypothetical protein